MTTITEKLAEALRVVNDRLGVVIECDNEDHGGAGEDDVSAYQAARATLAEYEASPRAYFPADYIREKLEKYDAEIADGTVSYALYAGMFSEIARGMLGRAS